MIVRLWFALLVAKLSTVVASKQQMAEELCSRKNVDKTPHLVTIIPYDTMFYGMVNKPNTTFLILVPQETGDSLSVSTMPCRSTLKWNLKFLPLSKDNRSMILLDTRLSKNFNIILSKLGAKSIIEYTGITRRITYNHGEHGKTYKGLYIITAETADDNSMVIFYVTLKQNVLPKNNFFFRPNGIKIKKGGHKISLRWNLSHIDHHFITYCLVISTSQVYSNLHDAENNLKERQKRNLTSNRSLSVDDDRLEIHYLEFSTNYTLTNLIYDKTYYFTVFALNGTHSSVHHANTTYIFQKPKPIALKDAKPKKIDLKAQSGKASFRYKVGNKPIDDSYSNTLYWYVMPCNGVVNVEIRCRKSILVQKKVFGYEKLVLNNTKRGERYVLKVETASVDETQLVKTIEVMATIRESKFPMPDMPRDLSVKPIYSQTDDCNSVKISWLTNTTNTNLRYCVSVLNYSQNNIEFSPKPDQCELSYGNSRRRDYNNRKRTRCYIGSKEEVEVQKISNLKSSTTYTIQVTVTKPRGRTLSYDLLKWDTNSCGLN